MLRNAATFQMNDEDVKNLGRLESIFRTNGFDPETSKTISIKDAMDIQNAAFLIPRVMTTMVQEGIEPLLIGTSLLQRIEYEQGMMTVFPAIEPLRAEEVADGADVPFVNINIGGAQSFALTVKRHGLGLKIHERFVKESTYPWINYWLRLAGNALARHKEEYIFSFITQLGTVVYDNNPAARLNTVAPGQYQPIKGVTTGRNYLGKLNGSMTLDDIFDMYAQVMAQGFIPDTLLVHPMTWLMWVKDPVLREFAIQAGGGSFFANWGGNPAELGNKFFNYRGLGLGQGQQGEYTQGQLTGGQTSKVQGLPQKQQSYMELPNYLGLPFRILVSPFVFFDPINRLTNILMFEARNLGALVVQEDPHVKDWSDLRYGIQYMAIEETYGFGMLHEAQAVAVAKNVKVRPNEFTLPARTVFNLSDSNSAFQDLMNPNTKIFDASAPIDVNNAT
jgi:hypothetical protein